MERLAPSNSSTYIFLMVALLFGLPLLTAYYNLDPSLYFEALIPYLVVSISIALVLLIAARNRNTLGGFSTPPSISRPSNFIAKFNSSLPWYVVLGLVTAAVAMFVSLRFLVLSTYPFPPPQALTLVGEAYIVLLLVTSILVFSRILYRGFPVLRQILRERKYALMSTAFSFCFAIVYFVLVNQILIGGFNAQLSAPGNLDPSGGVYPYAFAMSPGVHTPLVDLVYLPVVLVSLSPQFGLILIPFEMVFGVLLSLLVASNIVMAHYLITRSGLRCSTRGTLMSTGGSILGLTATCPTCLASTMVSVLFGGLAATELLYSNFYGIVLPPVISVVTLILSILFLNRTIKRKALV
jgi:hypothetical protein